jgi:succinoglycan biosynthesis protein ExoM
MVPRLSHITVCICTYRRPALLQQSLASLREQDTNGLFTYSIVVVDNDASQSGQPVVEAAGLTVPLTYCVEPEQNIALARNRAVQNAVGDFVAFLDDDEFASTRWLLTLFDTLRSHPTAAGVLGPVRPHFDASTPQWVIDGKFYERPNHRTGVVLGWSQCRTGNVLLRRNLLSGDAPAFRAEFLSGEDQDFFKRNIAAGYVFIWCNEAPVYEVVPPGRSKRRFLLRRAVFRGVFSHRNRRSSVVPIAHSLIAAPAWAVALPIALFLGHGKFMRCAFTLAYHVGRLLAVVGINPIKQRYVID